MRKLYIICFIFLLVFVYQSSTSFLLSTAEAQGPSNAALLRMTTARERSEEKRQNSMEEFETRQNEARERSDVKRLEVQERLQSVKDEQRKRLAEKLITNLDRMNQNWVSHWTKVLDNMSHILAKMEARVDKLEEVGHNTGDTRDKIAVAEMAITEAQNVLNEQAGKVYEVEFTDDTNLGSTIQAAIAELRADLNATRLEVRKAMQATREALTSLKSSAESEVNQNKIDEDEDKEEENDDNEEGGNDKSEE